MDFDERYFITSDGRLRTPIKLFANFAQSPGSKNKNIQKQTIKNYQ